MQRTEPLPVGAYTRRITGVPIRDGQGQAIVGAGGHATVILSPQGLGTTWYPVQLTCTTTTGVLDTSTCTAYLGPLIVATAVVGILYSGNGVMAVALPSLQPGQVLTVQWAQGNPGDTATVNVIGTMDALATG